MWVDVTGVKRKKSGKEEYLCGILVSFTKLFVNFSIVHNIYILQP
jgi:hypothetical protein